jgi:hypothetical protein
VGTEVEIWTALAWLGVVAVYVIATAMFGLIVVARCLIERRSNDKSPGPDTGAGREERKGAER